MRDPRDDEADTSKEHLLEDLETIRTLLDRKPDEELDKTLDIELDEALDMSPDRKSDDESVGQRQGNAPVPESEDAPGSPVPLLDDMIGGDLGIDEAPLDAPLIMDDAPGTLDDELFRTLLGDAWKSSASKILQTTRAEIEAYRENWAPEDTDALNDALRVRIDDTLKHWLRGLVRDNMHDLRTALLTAIDDQLKQEISRFLSDRNGHPQTRDNRSAQETDE
jgi:hypothetical protein